MKFKNRHQLGKIPEIEITPMLNVMLVVLAFFVAISTELREEPGYLEIRLPLASPSRETESPASEEPEFLTLHLQKGGQILADDRPIEIAELLQQIPGYLQNDPNRQIYLKPAADVAYETVVQTLVELKEIGGDRVSLVIGSTEEVTEESPKPTQP